MIIVSKATRKETHDFDDKAWHGEDVVHYGRPIEWKEKKFRFKAEDEGRIIGTASGKYEAGVVYIGALMVDKNVRKKGIGKTLITQVADWGRKNGAHKMWLTTGADWEANEFYQRLGFIKVADFSDHHFHHDFAVYSKAI